MVKPDTKSSNFTTSYGRPIYTINGLSERPDALLSVGSKGHEVSQENYEDDDFFLKTTKNETKELLQYYRVTLTFSGSRWFAAINKPDFKAEIVYNSEYHAFWEETYSDSTFLVSSSTDTGTPVGVPFFSPRRRSEKNYGNKDYGAFGILLPNADIEGVGFFQCYAYSEDCVVLDISVTTQNKTLPSNIEKYSDEDQIVSWELFKGDQVEQESASVLLERAQLVHSYCLPPDETYTFQMKDEICKSSGGLVKVLDSQDTIYLSMVTCQLWKPMMLFQCQSLVSHYFPEEQTTKVIVLVSSAQASRTLTSQYTQMHRPMKLVGSCLIVRVLLF